MNTIDADDFLTGFLRQNGLAAPDETPVYTALAGGVSSDIWRADLARGPVCVKRALAKLKVKADWFAPVERNAFEVAWMETANGLQPGIAPRVLAHDADQGVFAMAYLDPAGHPTWKDELHAGRADPAFARRVGECLKRVHAGTAGDDGMAQRFRTDETFYSIRLEPYLIATGRAHADLAPRMEALAKTTAAHREALVHGDVSPKNILVDGADPVFLDAECAWYGDPAFDLAFCLNHLLLKCLWTPAATDGFLACFDALAAGYAAAPDVEARAAALLPALFLARVDGKSPVEYITADADRDRVRRTARPLIMSPPPTLSGVRQAWERELRR
ncbi:aminoglycoside phosphotransferase family protein [Thalassospiraceae bacterium LMO-SO8]|nr:aminoglycoside phosphotransferase family protein [Alphaproteobacteria bacterium LMO-S08]WND76168.1 aminoglycoside phosphotransferase family protein [Thalassospiraceae bacterium LMO-SO8]